MSAHKETHFMQHIFRTSWRIELPKSSMLGFRYERIKYSQSRTRKVGREPTSFETWPQTDGQWSWMDGIMGWDGGASASSEAADATALQSVA